MGYSYRVWNSLSFTRKMEACIALFDYTLVDFEFYNQAYKLLDGLSDDQKRQVCIYAEAHK